MTSDVTGFFIYEFSKLDQLRALCVHVHHADSVTPVVHSLLGSVFVLLVVTV